MTGFAVNHKLSFPTALSLQIAGLNVSRREIILNSNVVLMSVTKIF